MKRYFRKSWQNQLFSKYHMQTNSHRYSSYLLLTAVTGLTKHVSNQYTVLPVNGSESIKNNVAFLCMCIVATAKLAELCLSNHNQSHSSHTYYWQCGRSCLHRRLCKIHFSELSAYVSTTSCCHRQNRLQKQWTHVKQVNKASVLL